MFLIFAGALQKIFPKVRVVLYMQLHFFVGEMGLLYNGAVGHSRDTASQYSKISRLTFSCLSSLLFQIQLN